jgi:hypothetical protein
MKMVKKIDAILQSAIFLDVQNHSQKGMMLYFSKFGVPGILFFYLFLPLTCRILAADLFEKLF